MSNISLDSVKKVVVSKGYKWFNDNNNKGYDVNIVGIRNSETDGKITNHFDDNLTISYKNIALRASKGGARSRSPNPSE